ncbi:MAG: ABC-2 family transporter protein [Candidatus Dojkabacteria bacterium]|nr:ABC-2 family transporter protein [Candidatus Dojkabacteria bacterium]
MDNIKRYLKLYSLFIKVSIVELMSHRFNLMMSALANIVWTMGQLISLKFLFSKIDTFQGWEFKDMILLLVFSQIYVYLFVIIFFKNFRELPKKLIFWRARYDSY